MKMTSCHETGNITKFILFIRSNLEEGERDLLKYNSNCNFQMKDNNVITDILRVSKKFSRVRPKEMSVV